MGLSLKCLARGFTLQRVIKDRPPAGREVVAEATPSRWYGGCPAQGVGSAPGAAPVCPFGGAQGRPFDPLAELRAGEYGGEGEGAREGHNRTAAGRAGKKTTPGRVAGGGG